MLNICNDHGFFAIISFLSAVSGGRAVGGGGVLVPTVFINKQCLFVYSANFLPCQLSVMINDVT